MAIATSRPNSAPRPSARFLGLALLAACSGSGDRGVPLDAGVAPSDGPSASDDGGRALDASVSAPDTPPDSGDGGRALDGADGPVSVDGADAGGGDAGQVETSPGTTIVRLKLAPGSSFCDSHTICDPVRHIFVRDSSGRPLTVALPGCALVCSQACLPPVCPGAACFPQGFPLSGEELVWTGRYYERSACGAGLGCYREHYAPAGSYVAVVCATPGVSTRPDGGGNYTCTNTAARQCVEIPFAFPSASPVEVTLGPWRGIPLGRDYQQAAACAEGAHYAINFLREVRLGSGQDVLVNGATGAIGSAAVQLLKQEGVQVTAVCATPQLELVRTGIWE